MVIVHSDVYNTVRDLNGPQKEETLAVGVRMDNSMHANDKH